MTDAIEVKKERIQRQIANYERELIRLDTLPEEPMTDGDFCVIAFRRQIGERYYDYCAIKAAGLWWLTGHEPGIARAGRTWGDFIERLGQWHVSEMWLAIQWEEV